MPAEPLTLRPFSPLDRLPGAGTVVVVPGRGVPSGVYDWLAEGAVHAGWAAVVADGLYAEPLDDRGGPAAYAALADALAAGPGGGPGGEAGPLVAVGHSTGARVALALAARLPLAGVAALCGIADLADHVSRAARFLPDYVAAVTSALGRPEDDPAAYAVRSPVTWIDRIRCPLLLVAGAEDRVCPAYQTELLAEAARTHGLPVDRHIVPGAGHFFETRAATGTARPDVLAAITAWLAALVETPAPRTRPERTAAP